MTAPRLYWFSAHPGGPLRLSLPVGKPNETLLELLVGFSSEAATGTNSVLATLY